MNLIRVIVIWGDLKLVGGRNKEEDETEIEKKQQQKQKKR
jgi:hypothetical protein